MHNRRDKGRPNNTAKVILRLVLVSVSILGWCGAAEDAKVEVIDQGKLVVYENGKRLSEEIFILSSDGSLKGIWKSIAYPSEPVLSSSITTKAGRLLHASLRWDGESLTAKAEGRTITVQRSAEGGKSVDYSVTEILGDDSTIVGQRAGRPVELVAAPEGAFFFDTLLWHPYVLIMRSYDYNKGGVQRLPAVEPREVVGLLTLEIAPEGVEEIHGLGEIREARHFTVRIKAGNVTIGLFQLWTSLDGQLLKGEWGGVEVIRQEPQENRCGLVAFVSQRDGNREIYVMNSDGTDQTRLTNNPAEDLGPSWCPDGSKIAFVSERDGNPETYVMSWDGTNVTRLTYDNAYDGKPHWSPDGTRIAFQSFRDGNSEIYVMNSDGTNQRNLTNNPAEDMDPSWSPDGTKVAFVSVRLLNMDIYVMNSDGKNEMRLTDDPARDEEPCWSPDGKRIAFTSYRNGNPEIYVMNPDGTKQENLTGNLASEGQPSWSSDGSRIAFVSDRDGNAEIYGMNSDGSKQTRLTENQGKDSDPCWAPAPENKAILHIVSEPAGATVKVNGWESGTAPVAKSLSSATLTPQEYFVALELPGYKPWLSSSFTLFTMKLRDRRLVSATLVRSATPETQ